MKNGFISPIVTVLSLLLLTLSVTTLLLAQWHYRSARAYAQSVVLMYIAQSALELAWQDFKETPVEKLVKLDRKPFPLPPGLAREGETVEIEYAFDKINLNGYLQAKASARNMDMQQTAGVLFVVVPDESGQQKLERRYYRE